MIQSSFPVFFGRARMVVAGYCAQKETMPLRPRADLSSVAQNQDAVEVSLSRSKNKTSADAADQTNASVKPSQPGLMQQMLLSISTLAEQMKIFQQKLNEGALSADQQAAYRRELSTLAQEYERVIGSAAYKRISEITQQVQQSLQSGSSTDAVYSSLNLQRGILGDGFLSVVQRGDLYELGVLGEGLSKISSVDAKSLTDDAALLEDVTRAVRAAAGVLTGLVDDEEETAGAPVPVIQSPYHPIQVRQMIFAGDQQAALSLRTYSPEDMIRLAAAGVEVLSVSELTLIPNPLSEGKTRPVGQ